MKYKRTEGFTTDDGNFFANEDEAEKFCEIHTKKELLNEWVLRHIFKDFASKSCIVNDIDLKINDIARKIYKGQKELSCIFNLSEDFRNED